MTSSISSLVKTWKNTTRAPDVDSYEFYAEWCIFQYNTPVYIISSTFFVVLHAHYSVQVGEVLFQSVGAKVTIEMKAFNFGVVCCCNMAQHES